MVKVLPVTIVDVGYRSTNYWVVSAGTSRLLVDIGWPGTLGTMKANLRRMDVPLREIRYALATHYHIDHAGLAEELKREGVPLLVLDVQIDAIPIMKTWTKPRDNYVDITGRAMSSSHASRAANSSARSELQEKSFIPPVTPIIVFRSCSMTAQSSPGISRRKPMPSTIPWLWQPGDTSENGALAGYILRTVLQGR